MKPQIKASLALPFAIAAIAGALLFLVNHPTITMLLLVIPVFLGMLGFIWYVLYLMFGGEPL